MHIHTQELDIGEHSKLINLFQYILNGKYQSLFKNSANKNEYSINHSASGVISHQDDHLLLGEKNRGLCCVKQVQITLSNTLCVILHRQ